MAFFCFSIPILDGDTTVPCRKREIGRQNKLASAKGKKKKQNLK